jgi:uncharacterized membrane protein HdeD (DUF308 family)
VHTDSFSGIITLFSAAGDAANRGMKILLGIPGIISGLAILAYPIYSALLLPFIFIILVGVWALILGGIRLYQGLTGGDGESGHLASSRSSSASSSWSTRTWPALALPFVLGIFGIIFGFAAIIGAFMGRSGEKAA